MARCGQQRHNVVEAVNVVGPPVQQEDGGTSGWTSIDISDTEDAGIDLLHGTEGRMHCAILPSRTALTIDRVEHTQPPSCYGRERTAEEATAAIVNRVSHGLFLASSPTCAM